MVTEQELIESMRESGREYLMTHPEAFGGGIDAETGVRTTTPALSDELIKPEVMPDPKTIEEERGVITITKSEEEKVREGGKAYWLLESETPRGALEEGSWTSGIQQKTRAIDTRGLYEYNVRNIVAVKEQKRQYENIVTEFEKDPKSFEGRYGVMTTKTEEGTRYQLTPDFFKYNINAGDIYNNALLTTKTKFSELPKSTRRRLTIASYGQGIASAGIGILEFGGTIVSSLGVQKFGVDDEGNLIKPKPVKFGGMFKDIRTYPTTQATVTFWENPRSYISQKLRSPEVLGQATVIVPLAYGGVKSTVYNIRTLGWKAGAVETLSGVSPLKIRSGVYAQPITKDTSFTNVRSIKSTTGRITTRAYTGSSGQIKLYGVERSAIVGGKAVGGGLTVTKTPFIKISGGGWYATQGTRTIYTPYTFGSAGSGTAFKSIKTNFYTQILGSSVKAGTSNIITSKGYTTYTIDNKAILRYSDLTKAFRSTGGSAYKDVKTGVRVFRSGQAKPFYQTKYYGDTTTYAPSGEYALDPKLSGVEYDLNVLFKKTGGLGYFSGRDGGIGTITKLKSTGINVIISPTTTPTEFKSPKIILPKIIPDTQTTKQIIDYKPSTQFIKFDTPQIDSAIDERTITIPKIITTERSKGSSGSSRQTIITIPNIIQTTKPKTKQTTATTPIIVQVHKIKVPQIQRSATTGLSGYSYGYGGGSYPPYIPTIPFPIKIPVILAGGKAMGLGLVRPQISQKAYTPSLSALFFKIRGRKPSGRATGFRFRPIIKGFRFTKQKKNIIKVRKIRI